jgi:hypothetical protein
MVDGCGLKHFGRGYCRTHYERWKRNGDVQLRSFSGPCLVDGCDRRKVARGLCKPHYRRLMKHGDPLAPKQPPKRQDAYERFLENVTKTEGCWLWTGGLWETGYGRFWFDGRTVLAHRWSYEHHTGPIPKGRHLDHLCRVRECVRPDHLEPVTARENLMRGETAAARNAAKTECPYGHPYDEANTYRDKRGRRSCIKCRDEREVARRERKRLEREQSK